MNTALNTTLKRNVFDLSVEGIDYSVITDLKKLHDSDEIFFNATDIVKQYNDAHPKQDPKLLGNFTKSRRFKDLTEILLFKLNSKKKDLYFKKGTGNKVQTWLHKDLFLSLMIWIDAKHEIAVTQFVSGVIKMIGNAREIRTEEKDRHLSYTDALKTLYGRLQDAGTSQPEHFFYTTIQRKIAKKATGEVMKQGGTDHDGNEARVNAIIAILRGNVQQLANELNEVDQDHRTRNDYSRSARDDKKEIYAYIESFEVIDQYVA